MPTNDANSPNAHNRNAHNRNAETATTPEKPARLADLWDMRQLESDAPDEIEPKRRASDAELVGADVDAELLDAEVDAELFDVDADVDAELVDADGEAAEHADDGSLSEEELVAAGVVDRPKRSA